MLGETLLQDLRYSLRALAKNPGFTAVAVIALALGIGANAAIFSVVSAVLLQPLPYQDPNRLAVILHRGRNPVAAANFLDWRSQSKSFERMGAAEYWAPDLTGVDQPERLWALRVTADIFPLLGVEPVLGRVFLPDEDQRGKEHQAVISHGLWQRRFAGDAGLLGRTLTLDNERYTIIGVMPRGFMFSPFWATKAELWTPLPLADRAANRGGNSLRLFARLKSGVTLEQARSEMAAITGRLEQQYPGTNRDVRVVSLNERVVGNIQTPLLVMLGAVGFVLLIACANVAHMLLARAAARQKEIAVRMAIGAGRGRVIRQFLTESLLLSFLGGGAGLLLAAWGIRVLIALSPPGIPRVATVGFDGRVLLFLTGMATLTGLALGLATSWRASAVNCSDALKEGVRGSSDGAGRNRLRSLLVVSEFALALMLLVGAGLMIRSFLALQAIDPGFRPSRLLTMVVSVAGSRTAEPSLRAAFFQQLLERVRAIPGVESAGTINHLPLAGDLWGWSFHIEGRPEPRPGEAPGAVYRVVQPGYFQAMRIPILRGRDISDSDRRDSTGAVVVNEKLAREYWPGEDAIGKRIIFPDSRNIQPWLTVVGVVANSRQDRWADAPEPEAYLAYLQNSYYLEDPRSPYTYQTLVVRTAGDPSAATAAVQSAVWSLDRNVTVSQVQTMDQVVADATAAPRFYLLLLATFAGTALILAAVGIYGVMSYSVTRRTQEIGIRMALGAGRGHVLRHVVGQGMILAAAGAAAGWACALALARVMTTLLYVVQPADPLTFAAVPLVLLAVALAACYIPARRATRIDPLAALRYE